VTALAGFLAALVSCVSAQAPPNGVTGPWSMVNDSFLCFWDPFDDRSTKAVSCIWEHVS